VNHARKLRLYSPKVKIMASANSESSSKGTVPLLASPALMEKYHNFKKLHDEAYRLIENGIELEQDGQKQEVCYYRLIGY